MSIAIPNKSCRNILVWQTSGNKSKRKKDASYSSRKVKSKQTLQRCVLVCKRCLQVASADRGNRIADGAVEGEGNRRAPGANGPRCKRSSGAVDAADRTADDTRNRHLFRMLVEVLGNVGHGDGVEADGTTMTATKGVQVPDLDVLLLLLGQTGELDRSSMLVSKVHGGLHHVARGAAVVHARAVAEFDAGRVTTRRVKAGATGTIHGTLKLGDVVRTRERLFGAGEANLIHHLSLGKGDDDTRAAERSLLHDRRVAELLNKRLASLNRRIRNLGGLVRVEAGPEAMFDAVEELDHAVGVGEVDEGITDVAARLEVYAKVEEVVCAEAGDVDHVLESHLSKGLASFQDGHGREDLPSPACSGCFEA